jgi:hypothetical protein
MPLATLDRVLRSRRDAEFGAGATDATIRAAEDALAIAFPASVREYLNRFGYIAVGPLELYGLGDDVPAHLDIVRITTSERTESGCPLPQYLVPLMNDGFGNLYCAAVTGEDAGAIMLWDHEAGSEQQPAFIAASFEQWLVADIEHLDEAPR